MSGKKTGYILHFSHYPMFVSLPPEQRGLIITALYVYADRLDREEEVTAEEIAEQFPQLTQEARMALSFMAVSVEYDTRRWKEQKRARLAAREAKRGDSSARDPDAAAREAEACRRDMERLRRAMEETE